MKVFYAIMGKFVASELTESRLLQLNLFLGLLRYGLVVEILIEGRKDRCTILDTSNLCLTVSLNNFYRAFTSWNLNASYYLNLFKI